MADAATRLCSIEGCDRPRYGRGWCLRHYNRLYSRGGDPAVLLVKPHVTEHGSWNEYQNYGCRCDPCRAAASEYMRAHYTTPCAQCGEAMVWKRGTKPSTGLCPKCLGLSRRTAEHGTETRYSSGCRCRPCKDASAAARRRRRARVAA
jgi:hypothetical protein